MSTPFFQDVNPAPAPDPADSAPGRPDVPSGDGTGPALYSISAPQDIGGITAAADAAGALAGAGIVYGAGPRQAEARAILESPQGADSSNVFAGFPDYENQDLRPATDLETPIQGAGYHPGTTQDGLAQYGTGGIEGVSPETGSMAGSADEDYPGTTQGGLPVYGTG